MPQTATFFTAALYKFVRLDDFESLQLPLIAVCERHQVKGTLLLAQEGINGTIAGPYEGVQAVLAFVRQDSRLADIAHKEAWASKEPFYRLKVRLKKEIVTLGVPGVSPTKTVGRYVKPTEWNELIQDPSVVLIDTRNDYEAVIGSFKGAVDPKVKSFSQLPQWLTEQEKAGGVLNNGRKASKVAMFCTGGIRCEKSTSYLKSLGYEEVYHLEGGILKYLEEIPADQSLWQGQCFVFDERVSVGHGLQEGGLHLCRSCRHPLTPEDRASEKFQDGIACPHCHDHLSADQRTRFAERQKQMALAKARGQRHVGAKVPNSAGAATGKI